MENSAYQCPNMNGSYWGVRRNCFPDGPKTQSISSSGTEINDSWRKQASIDDWEAYIYSTSRVPVNNLMTQKTRFDVNGLKSATSTQSVIPRAGHEAHISFIHTTDGVLKPIVTRKRKRTAFTTEQVEELESIFYKRPYVSREDRQVLVKRLQVPDKSVKVWFQNRRLKSKKEIEKQEIDYFDPEILTDLAHKDKHLAYVDAQIGKADEFGYVTLDDRAIHELVTVIDRVLPQNVDLSEKPKHKDCSEIKINNSDFYEPISPPDSPEVQDGFLQHLEGFEAIEPVKSVQYLSELFACS